MQLGDILVGRGLVNAADIEAALARQLTEGGRLGDNLVALGKIKPEDLDNVMHQAPPGPRTTSTGPPGMTVPSPAKRPATSR